jgi:hypothetical protein
VLRACDPEDGAYFENPVTINGIQIVQWRLQSIQGLAKAAKQLQDPEYCNCNTTMPISIFNSLMYEL